MNSATFVIVLDTPSIKRFVFGTDALNEVRGASALLDQLNRDEMAQQLRQHPDLAQAQIEQVYANGGSAQFLAHDCDKLGLASACKGLVRYVREQTAGEVQLLFGIAELSNNVSYHDAIRAAHFQLRCQRDFATCHRGAALMPFVMECQSASHLPATHIDDFGAEGIQLLSDASHLKRQWGRDSRRHGIWTEWMQYLSKEGTWPSKDQWGRLRCESVSEIGNRSTWRNYIGVVYADGNSMGKVVQSLDRPETFRQFSHIVDVSIREACFKALGHVSRRDIDQARECLPRLRQLPADILLLGGDDLLVALPADRALEFTLEVTAAFERLTRERIAALQDPEIQRFFHAHVGDRGFTISCGVAIAKSSYPFYLSLDLAEQLLKNAKSRGSSKPPSEGPHSAPTFIDFHVVAGANSHTLDAVRVGTYRTSSNETRTLRPLSRTQLVTLRESVLELRSNRFPRNKLHALQGAALELRESQAGWHIKDIFGRSQHTSERSQRQALWQAIHSLKPDGYTFNFPWFVKDDQRLLCVADLMEAYDLFPK